MLRIVSLISLIAFVANQIDAVPQFRIANGAVAKIHDFPYQVSVNAYDKYQCSGVIISEDWVLTTTHCLRFPRDVLSIRSGSEKLTGGSVRKVAKVIEHDHYYSQLARFNDISLVKVEEKFEFDEKTQPIELVDKNVSVTEGHVGIISGWGTERNEDTSLKAVTTNVMSLLDCMETYHSRYGNFLPGVICAKNERPGGAACSTIWSSDDSGAPLVVDNKLAGIFSWGYRCEEPGFPSVFMEIAYFRDWIKQNTGI